MKESLLRNNFKLFFDSSLHAFLVYLFLSILLMSFRLIILFFFNSSPHIYNETEDILNALFMGFRFDTIVICYSLFAVMFFNLVGIATFARGERYFISLKRILRIYYTLITLLILCTSIIDLYFYNFFQTRISVLVFGFFEDDTIAVLQSIWKDYPLISIFAGLVLAGFGSYKLVGYIQKTKLPDFKLPVYAYAGGLIVMGIVFAYGARGTFAYFPLRNSDTVISRHVFINKLVPNGIFAANSAFKDHRSQNVDTDIEKTMKKWGFTSPDEAVSAYLERSVAGDADSLRQALTAYTPFNDFLEQEPPNVVFIMMESMSEHFISLHNRENFNLLGTLEDVLPECIHFNHFLSASRGTIHTLEGLLLNNPMTPFSQSRYMTKTLETSAAKPFKEKGYHTSFVSGSKMGWRNMDKFIPHQYIDDTEGSAHIMKYIPHVISNEWGCFDEFMFTRMHDILDQGSETPQFIFGMTITNHTPHSLPKTYQPYPLEIPEEIKHSLSSSEEYAHAHFLTYQYANNCLGKFISDIKQSPLGENTIIVASGDHTARRMFEYSDADMLQQYAVPLIMYVPHKYLKDTEMPDVSAFASHKDVFPTIYHLALSDAAYVKSGVNLWDKDALASNFAISSYQLVMNSLGGVFSDVENMYYVWTDEKKTSLQLANDTEKQLLNKDMHKAKAYAASMTYLVQKDLQEKTAKQRK